MRKIIVLFFLMLFLNEAEAQSSAAEQLANKIAQKMKDSLTLSDQQKTQLYTINIQLSDQKAVVRQQYTGVDSLRYYLQRLENNRDSLYRTVLNEEKYQLYRQKKKNLVNNN